MAIGIGYGKIILFGEHFVVHGCPAIGLGISNRAVVEIEKAPETGYTSETSGTIPELTTAAIRNVLEAMKIQEKFEIHLKGDLPTTGGLGSSAAFCVALARALDQQYKMGLTNEQVNQYAYEGERAFHGNPSGIDNVMATYGGAIRFIRNKGFQQVKVGVPLNLVVGITGISSPTARMVEGVSQFKEKNRKMFDNMLETARGIVEKGEAALGRGDVLTLGNLMNANQDLLYGIGVSADSNEHIIRIANENGALGAKLTGGGGGGCCIALAKDETHAQGILAKIKEAGYDGFVTKVRPSVYSGRMG